MKRRLLALPLAAWEREGLKSALVKAGLPADDVGDPHQLFWRFESHEDVPVGFGGLEVHGDEALLHSVVTLWRRSRTRRARTDAARSIS